VEDGWGLFRYISTTYFSALISCFDSRCRLCLCPCTSSFPLNQHILLCPFIQVLPFNLRSSAHSSGFFLDICIHVLVCGAFVLFGSSLAPCLACTEMRCIHTDFLHWTTEPTYLRICAMECPKPLQWPVPKKVGPWLKAMLFSSTVVWLSTNPRDIMERSLCRLTSEARPRYRDSLQYTSKGRGLLQTFFPHMHPSLFQD